MKKFKRERCRHGFINCLLCSQEYTPTSPTGELKYIKMIIDKPITDKEVVFLKSKIAAGLNQTEPLQSKLPQTEKGGITKGEVS